MSRAWCINRPFTYFWLGQSLSQLGDAVLEVTLPIWVGLLTNDPAQVAGVAIAEVLPALCLGPLAGVVADRWPARRIMLACDLLRGLLLCVLLLVPHSALPEAIEAVSFCSALLANLFNPAKNVTIRLVVPQEALGRAQALARATQSGALIAGPMLGAGIVFWLGPASGVLVDVLSFGVSAAAFLLLPTRSHPSPPSPGSLWAAWQTLWHEVWAGMQFAVRQRWLSTLMLVNSVLALTGSLWYAVDVFFVQDSLGMPKASVGLLWTASGVGGLLGGVLLVFLTQPGRQVRFLLGGLVLRGSSLLWYALMVSYAWAVPAALLAGLGEAFVSSALWSLVLAQTEEPLVGRVTALFDTTSQLTTLCALLTVGSLSRSLSPWHILSLCGGALVLVGLGAALRLRPPRMQRQEQGTSSSAENLLGRAKQGDNDH